ncbi:hypothetical protein [Caballeronia udeis]|uniref:hypothetical protein n=1 Tax=Caballeronia udeis TaxID=1232866 RepID=UPI0022B224F6|nr:hypothetical protein [Caballeronia udeis]
MAGDSCSFTGGWVEGALQTGINAVCAVIRSLSGSVVPSTRWTICRPNTTTVVHRPVRTGRRAAGVETRVRGALIQKKTRTRRVLVSQFRMAERVDILGHVRFAIGVRCRR